MKINIRYILLLNIFIKQLFTTRKKTGFLKTFSFSAKTSVQNGIVTPNTATRNGEDFL